MGYGIAIFLASADRVQVLIVKEYLGGGEGYADVKRKVRNRAEKLALANGHGKPFPLARHQ